MNQFLGTLLIAFVVFLGSVIIDVYDLKAKVLENKTAIQAEKELVKLIYNDVRDIKNHLLGD